MLLSWGTAIITAINISLYLFVYYRYGIPFLLNVLWPFIIVFSFACLFLCCRYGNWCYRASNHPIEPRRWANDRPSNHPIQTTHFNDDGPVIGIEEDTLDLFPKMLYSDKVCQSFKSAEGKELDEAEDKTCCSICFSDYKGSEVVKIIPDCGHMFHIDCIDKWLRRHATCPICRTAPLPSRSALSLAQAVVQYEGEVVA